MASPKTEGWQHFLPNEPQIFYGNTDDNTAEVYGVTETMAFPGKTLAYIKQDRLKLESAHRMGSQTL